MQTITVPLGERSYPIHIERGLLAKTGAMIREKLGDIAVAVVSDDHVAPLYMEEVVSSMEKVGLRVCSIVLPHGEQTKCLKSLET
ncbi:MAG: 3-dehydroquinate synthase, partial [Christensenellales bacterium]